MITNEKNITIEMLDGLGVYELRELARSIGVSSPTTKKREVLCREIMQISTGAVKVDLNTPKKGRPPKTITKISNMVNEYIPPEILKLQKPLQKDSYTNILKLAQNPNFLSELNLERCKEVLGFLDSVNGHFYLNNLKNSEMFRTSTFYVQDDLIKRYNLREGDKIFGHGEMADNYDCGILSDISKINDIDVLNWSRSSCEIDISNFTIPRVPSTVFGKEIKKGERTISYFQNSEQAILAVVDEIERKEDSDEKIVFVGVELAPEILFYGKSKSNVEMFATTFYNNLDESYNTIINALNYSTSLLKDGKNVTLFIFDVVGMLTRLDQHFASNENLYMGHNITGVQIIKKLVGMGKAVSSDLSITSHAIAFVDERNDMFVKSELEKIAKVI